MHDIKYAYYVSSKGFRVVGGTAAQFLKADGSVDSTSYLAPGMDINMGTGSLSRFENTTRVFNNVYQRLLGTAQTGILSFKFPQATSQATMFEVTIKIFGWNARILGTIKVAFYKFTATVINSNHKAIIECSDNFPTTIINVGLDASGNVCINIGESTTVWNTYLKVEVERVVAFHQGANFDWSKGWSQTIETDVSTYTQLVPIATEVVATRTWVDQNNTGSVPKTPALLSTSDLNTILTPGFYYQHASSNATTLRNYPILLAGYLNVYKSSSTRVVQEYNDLQYGRTWKRVYDGVNFSLWLRVWSETDFTQANINTWNNSVQQSALSNYYTKNEALNTFVGKNGVETISDTKTFTHSPIVPNATLDSHAVNYGQMDWLLNATLGGYVPLGLLGVQNGVATLGADGKVPGSQLPELDKDISQEDGSLRLSVFDRVFTGMSNSFDTDKRIVKITLTEGGTISMQHFFPFQEITVMNISGNAASFTVDNTSANVYLQPKSSATIYVNKENQIILVRIDNGNCGALN